MTQIAIRDASVPFLLPNGAMRSPDAAWVERSRWQALEPEQHRKFVLLAPDFVLELRSPSDRLPDFVLDLDPIW